MWADRSRVSSSASISPDLKYTEADRDLNTKRLAYIGRLLTRNGTHTIVAAVSSRRSHRDRAREWTDRFFECHVKTSVDECRKRDPKGLYAKALRGEIRNFTGVDDPYERPKIAEVTIDTTSSTPESDAGTIVALLVREGFLE